MAVADPTTVDQVAEGPDGRILLAMTEDRRYSGGDAEAMTEDFRQKLNAYVYLIRSGQLRQMLGGRDIEGVDIRLYTLDEPPAAVREMIELASGGLASDRVNVGWQMHARSAVDCLGDIGRSLVARAPRRWVKIELTATLIGDGLAGGLLATLRSGKESPLDPDPVLIGALKDLKRARWSPDHGTWLTFRATIDGQQITPFYDHDNEPPGGAAGFTPDDWAEELRRFPRATVPEWWRAQLG